MPNPVNIENINQRSDFANVELQCADYVYRHEIENFAQMASKKEKYKLQEVTKLWESIKPGFDSFSYTKKMQVFITGCRSQKAPVALAIYEKFANDPTFKSLTLENFCELFVVIASSQAPAMTKSFWVNFIAPKLTDDSVRNLTGIAKNNFQTGLNVLQRRNKTDCAKVFLDHEVLKRNSDYSVDKIKQLSETIAHDSKNKHAIKQKNTLELSYKKQLYKGILATIQQPIIERPNLVSSVSAPTSQNSELQLHQPRVSNYPSVIYLYNPNSTAITSAPLNFNQDTHPTLTLPVGFGRFVNSQAPLVPQQVVAMNNERLATNLMPTENKTQHSQVPAVNAGSNIVTECHTGKRKRINVEDQNEGENKKFKKNVDVEASSTIGKSDRRFEEEDQSNIEKALTVEKYISGFRFFDKIKHRSRLFNIQERKNLISHTNDHSIIEQKNKMTEDEISIIRDFYSS